MVSITQSIVLISALMMLLSGIVCAEFKTYNSGGSNLFVGGILEKSSNGDSAEQKWKDFAFHNSAVFVPAYYTNSLVDDINAVNAAAKYVSKQSSLNAEINGLARDELGANGPRSYGTIIGYSGGTISVITAMAVQDVKAETLILISPMMGNNENSGEVFEQKIRDIIKLNPNIQILVFQSEQDVMAGQYEFLTNDYLLNMFPNNIKVYSITLPLEKCVLLCHNYFFDTWAQENIKDGAYVGSVAPKVPIKPISQVLGLSATLWSQPTPDEYSMCVPPSTSPDSGAKVPTEAEFPTILPCV